MKIQLKDLYKNLNNPVGIQPINWSNDDFQDLGGDTSLETCLDEMKSAGFRGTELGHKFPKNPSTLQPLLESRNLEMISGWHSTYLATRELGEERISFLNHLQFLTAMGSSVVIVAECSYRTYHQEHLPLYLDERRPTLNEQEWKRLSEGLQAFSQVADGLGMKLVYHHHMGTVIQNEEEIDRLMEEVPGLCLLLDTGHLTYAGVDPVSVIRRWGERIAHVHLKDVRRDVLEKATCLHWSFSRAVREGVFTVPGDPALKIPGVDYPLIFEELGRLGYRGWFVVEAEQDPQVAVPRTYAGWARDYVRTLTGL